MRCTFYRLDQVLHVVVAQPWRQTQFPWMNRELLSIRLPGAHQTQPKKVVHCRLQVSARSANLAAKQLGDILDK